MAQRGGFVPLDIMIVLEGERQPYGKEITVTIKDSWGNIEGAQSTDKGFVQFAVAPGLHRMIIVGSEIEMYYDEFSLDRGPSSIQTIHVQPRRTLIKTVEGREAIDSAQLRVPKKARKEFDKAREAADKKNPQEAMARLRGAIRLYPQYDGAYAALGTLELENGDRASGRRDLETALRLNPGNAQASRKLAEILIATQQYAEAEPLLQASLRKQPTDVWALSYAALGLLVKGKWQEAAATAQKVHTLPHQGYASAHLIAGEALERLSDVRTAEAEYRLYLEEAPNGENAERARSALQRVSPGSVPTVHP